MRKLILFLLLISCITQAEAQVFNLFKSLAKKTGLFFSDMMDYANTDKAIAPYAPDQLPKQIDFSDNMPPVGNQMPQNSCVAWALGYGCRSYYVSTQTNSKFITSQKTLDYSGIISPAFIYNLLNNGKNKGTNLYRALRLLMDTGACSFESMPYQKYNWRKQPEAQQIAEAKNFKIETFHRVDMNYAVNNLKAQLATGTPVIIATKFDKHYYNFGWHNNNEKTPFYVWDKLYNPDDDMGHAVLLVGYSDSLKAFKFMNSWGTEWGNDGFGWITYQLAPQVIREAYVIKPKNVSDSLRVKINKNKRTSNDFDATGRDGSASDSSTILQRTNNANSDSDFQKYGLNVYVTSVFNDSGVATKQFPEGEPQISLVGSMNIPAGFCNKYQVVVRFYENHYGDKGGEVLCLDNEHKLASGFAAASTEINTAPAGEGVKDDWTASIPVSALDILKGAQTKDGYTPTVVKLIAEPILFADGFAVSIGKTIAFEVMH